MACETAREHQEARVQINARLMKSLLDGAWVREIECVREDVSLHNGQHLLKDHGLCALNERDEGSNNESFDLWGLANRDYPPFSFRVQCIEPFIRDKREQG